MQLRVDKKYSMSNPPLYIEEARSSRDLLIEKKKELESQISQRKPVGKISNEEWRNFSEWKQRINGLVHIIERQLIFLKKWIKENHPTKDYYEKLDPLAKELELLFQKTDFCRPENSESIEVFLRCLMMIKSAQTNEIPISERIVRDLVCKGYQVFLDLEQNNIKISIYQGTLKYRLLKEVFLMLYWDIEDKVFIKAAE